MAQDLLDHFLLVFENQLAVEKGVVAGRRDESSYNCRSNRSGTITTAMTLSRLAQRVPAPRLGPTARLSHRSTTTNQPQSSHSGIPNGRNLSTLRPDSCSLRAAHGAATTAAATCDSGEVNSLAADFRRSPSAAIGPAAPRCPTSIRWAPSVLGPILGNNTKSSRSHTNALLRSHHIPSATVLRAFSSSATVMAAAKIDGTAIARKVREGLRAEIEEKNGVNPRFQPSLKIIQGACVASRHRLNAGP